MKDCLSKDFDYRSRGEIKNSNEQWEKAPLRKIAASGNLMGFRHLGFWHPMDTLRDKNYLENLIQSDKAPWIKW